MLKLKLQYSGHQMGRTDSLEQTLMPGKTEGKEETTEEEMLDGITDSMDISLSKLRGSVMDGTAGVLQSMGSPRIRQD